MYKSTILILTLTILSLHSEGKVFTRCGLVYELRKQGFPPCLISNWVCLIEAESYRNTAVITDYGNGSRSWGLFQVNDEYWCSSSSTAGMECKVTCSDLITDDITKASNCAKLIYSRQNFHAWHGWVTNCNGKPLPDISMC